MTTIYKIIYVCTICLFAVVSSYAVNYLPTGSAIIVGDSTVSAYSGATAIATLLASIPDVDLTNITSIADPGDTIAQQKTAWQALSSGARSEAKYVIVQVGLNDLLPSESAATALSRYQDLIDTIASDSPSARIYTSQMTPCKQRLIDLYGATDGATSYQKWIDMNTAISGSGDSAITGMYGAITAHVAALDANSDGNLDAEYDTGDHIHENDDARTLIATHWSDKLVLDGTWYRSTYWYVSKAGAGAENGTIADNAWAQDSVTWESIAAGDTLYVIGELRGITEWSISANGSTNSYLIISGYDTTSGIILGTEHEATSWTGPDAYGAYYIAYTNDNCTNAIEWTTASGVMSSYSALTNAGKDPDETWTAGSFYPNTTSNRIYWKPFGGTVTGKTITVGADYSLFFDGSWIKFLNIKLLLTPITIGGGAASSYIWIDNINTKYVGGIANIKIRTLQTETGYQNSNIRISNSTISNGISGIYSIGQYEDYDNDQITIDHNTITLMENLVPGDAHCIGIQGGDGHIIEYNDLSYCNTGITMYSSIWQTMNNNTIRYNRVYNNEAARGNNTGYGIGWETTNTTPESCTGNAVYGNLVYSNDGFGINSKFVIASNYIYNNTASANSPNYKISTVNNVVPSVAAKNNISVDPTTYHWQIMSAGTAVYTGLSFDNNIYYPDGDAKFYAVSIGSPYTANFAGWKTHLGTLSITTADANSSTTDPAMAANLSLTAGSTAAIGEGDATLGAAYSSGLASASTWPGSVGLISRGAAWDIGAFEYAAGGQAIIGGAGTGTITTGGSGTITITP